MQLEIIKYNLKNNDVAQNDLIVHDNALYINYLIF